MNLCKYFDKILLQNDTVKVIEKIVYGWNDKVIPIGTTGTVTSESTSMFIQVKWKTQLRSGELGLSFLKGECTTRELLLIDRQVINRKERRHKYELD